MFEEATGATYVCFLNDSAIRRLDMQVWLGDEAIYAFLLLVVADSDIIAIDPLLIQTSFSFRISQYPTRQNICYIPLHMRKDIHWGLGVYDTSRGSICV